MAMLAPKKPLQPVDRLTQLRQQLDAPKALPQPAPVAQPVVKQPTNYQAPIKTGIAQSGGGVAATQQGFKTTPTDPGYGSGFYANAGGSSGGTVRNTNAVNQGQRKADDPFGFDAQWAADDKLKYGDGAIAGTGTSGTSGTLPGQTEVPKDDGSVVGGGFPGDTSDGKTDDGLPRGGHSNDSVAESLAGIPSSRFPIDEQFETFIRNLMGDANNVNTEEEEALIKSEMDRLLGQGLVDSRARAGAAGFAASGAQMATEGGIRRDAARDVTGRILDTRSKKKQQAIENAFGGIDSDIGLRQSAQDSELFDMILGLLGQEDPGGGGGDDSGGGSGGGSSDGGGGSGDIGDDVLDKIIPGDDTLSDMDDRKAANDEAMRRAAEGARNAKVTTTERLPKDADPIPAMSNNEYGIYVDDAGNYYRVNFGGATDATGGAAAKITDNMGVKDVMNAIDVDTRPSGSIDRGIHGIYHVYEKDGRYYRVREN